MDCFQRFGICGARQEAQSVKYSGTFGDERYPAVFHGIKPAFGSNTKLARVETTERRQCSVIENDRLADRQDAGSEQRARGDRKSTRLNSSPTCASRMPSSAY